MADTSSNSAISPLKIKKRTRCNNFILHEKNVLMSPIESYQEIIARKKNRQEYFEGKNQCWKRVTSDFNSILG